MLLPAPPFFAEHTIATIRSLPYQNRSGQAMCWAREHGITPSIKDEVKTALFLIDVQNTFCTPGFSLFVPGAVEDNLRLCRFLYQRLAQITTIVVTLDTHQAAQIFHPLFWIDGEGNHPPGTTIITVEDVETGRWQVNPYLAEIGEVEILAKHALHYVRQLAVSGKYPLMVWPYHALLGGIGHALVPAVEEAIFFHTIARHSQPIWEIKGQHPLTENYSVFAPEVRETWDYSPIGSYNQALIDRLLTYDRVFVAGQAKSHCVAWTIGDLLAQLQVRDSSLVKKFYLLEDCTSPVVIDGVVDYTEAAQESFDRFAQAGMTIVRTTDSFL